MKSIPYIDKEFIEEHTQFNELIEAIKKLFADGKTIVPQRHHHEFPNPKSTKDTTMLLMPAWNTGQDAGIKVVTVSPDNVKVGLPSIYGVYIYIEANTGIPKAIIEGTSLTAKRTAAASALASSFLSRNDASSLLMIGTGVLSANLINAHSTVRPIQKVYVWGRNFEKAVNVAEMFSSSNLKVEAINNIKEKIAEVDIISCATLSETPLVLGNQLRSGQHIDLVGAYKKNMRESDDETIRVSSVYVDTYTGGLKESGDIVQPLESGILNISDIQADLFELCSGRHQGRQSSEEITLFKSVGHAIEDLAGANYYFEKYLVKPMG